MKSSKTYSLMVNYKGKSYFIRIIDNEHTFGYNDYIIRLTNKASSAKKWKSVKGLITSNNEFG